MARRRVTGTFVVVLAASTACARTSPRPAGPRPVDGHHTAIAARHDDTIALRHVLAAPSAFRFEEPRPLRVAAWHWAPQQDGHVHQLGSCDGWAVPFRVTPHYEGYPPQPEAQRMAFFADGALRGLFARGGGTAPLELDAWSPLWVDPTWNPTAAVPAGPGR